MFIEQFVFCASLNAGDDDELLMEFFSSSHSYVHWYRLFPSSQLSIFLTTVAAAGRLKSVRVAVIVVAVCRKDCKNAKLDKISITIFQFRTKIMSSHCLMVAGFGLRLSGLTIWASGRKRVCQVSRLVGSQFCWLQQEARIYVIDSFCCLRERK